MKRILFVLVVVALVCSVSFAQLGITKGIKGGLNIANFGGADVGDAKAVTQFAAGVFLSLNLAGGISIQPEVLYSIKGSKGDVSPGVELTQTIQYIDIPVLVKYSLPVPGLKPSIFAGPSLGILTGAKIKGPGGEADDKDAFESTDFGLVFGAGIQIPLGGFDLTVDARYDMGLSKIVKVVAPATEAPKAYNRVISVYVGLAL